MNPTLTVDEWLSILLTSGFACARCGSDDNLAIAHLIPIGRGGTHSRDNVAPLCGRCNVQMHERTPLEWLAGISVPKAENPHSAKIEVLCTPAEKAAWKAAAGEQKLSAWARDLLNQAASAAGR